jgi:oligoendopeptidase F
VEEAFDRLQGMAPQCRSAADLEDWLRDWSELTAAIDQEGVLRNIAMTCHTDDAEAEGAYLDFIENIEPRVKPRQFALAQAYSTHALRSALPARYHVFDRDTMLHVDLFRPENVPLETREARLGQAYQKLNGSLTVRFRGEERTLVQMGKFLEETDRALRQEAWEMIARRRLQEREQFEDLFEKSLGIREQIAKNAGSPNYRHFAFRRLGRFDYTPEDCLKFHEAVAEEVMPLLAEIHERRRTRLGLGSLRPWDLAVDPLNRGPLQPFQKIDQLVARTQAVFDRMDPELAGDFALLRGRNLLDLANRKGKAPGGYQSTLAEARVPFIFMNAVGQQRDVETLLHEAGHAFHALATREEDLYLYRNPPMEFCEVASMSMELLANHLLEEFYSPAEAQRARLDHLEGIISILAWIATVDAFQHWIYTHPGHTRAQRTAAWLEQMDRFGSIVDWSGYEDARSCLWHRQLHIFLHPFYYIEYGIAQLGALQLWANYRRDPAEALRHYKQALALGNSRPLPDLFAAGGCVFDFSRSTMRPLVALIRKELDSANGA